MVVGHWYDNLYMEEWFQIGGVCSFSRVLLRAILVCVTLHYRNKSTRYAYGEQESKICIISPKNILAIRMHVTLNIIMIIYIIIILYSNNIISIY